MIHVTIHRPTLAIRKKFQASTAHCVTVAINDHCVSGQLLTLTYWLQRPTAALDLRLPRIVSEKNGRSYGATCGWATALPIKLTKAHSNTVNAAASVVDAAAGAAADESSEVLNGRRSVPHHQTISQLRISSLSKSLIGFLL